MVPVVGQPGEVWREVRAGHVLERRRRQRKHLRVALVPIHDLEAAIDVDHDRNVLDAFDHQSRARSDLHQTVVKRPRQDVREDVDLEHA